MKAIDFKNSLKGQVPDAAIENIEFMASCYAFANSDGTPSRRCTYIGMQPFEITSHIYADGARRCRMSNGSYLYKSVEMRPQLLRCQDWTVFYEAYKADPVRYKNEVEGCTVYNEYVDTLSPKENRKGGGKNES